MQLRRSIAASANFYIDQLHGTLYRNLKYLIIITPTLRVFMMSCIYWMPSIISWFYLILNSFSKAQPTNEIFQFWAWHLEGKHFDIKPTEHQKLPNQQLFSSQLLTFFVSWVISTKEGGTNDVWNCVLSENFGDYNFSMSTSRKVDTITAAVTIHSSLYSSPNCSNTSLVCLTVNSIEASLTLTKVAAL